MKAWFLAGVMVAVALAGCTQQPDFEDDSGDVRVRQDEGTVYWVLPGPRRLGAEEWGTPEQPKQLVEDKLDAIRALPAPYNETVMALVQKEPAIVGLPLEARGVSEDGSAFTQTKKPTPMGDEGRIVSGAFDVTYRDRTPWDLASKFDAPGATPDSVDATARFTDPQGNEYELRVKQLRQWSFQENGGGVVTGSFIHGSTGVDSPLMPRIFAYGAFWGIGDVVVNGDVVNSDQWIHFMTTQTVRDKDYRLATQEELPLALENTIAGREHHTHIIVRPIKATPEGPVFEPVHTAFELPNGMNQPFLHIMFEQEEIVSGPFAEASE